MTIVGIVAAGTQTFITMRYTPAQPWPLPQIDMTWTLAAIGGVVGVLISTALLRLGVFTYSFADYDQYVKDDEPIAEYPHARREMLKEILFLLPIISGCIIGFILGYEDRKSTRLNSSHVVISYAAFCLKKKTTMSRILMWYNHVAISNAHTS